MSVVCPESNSYIVRLSDGRLFRRTHWAINISAIDSKLNPGSVLGPIFYVLYILPMHEKFASTGILDDYYADDTQEYQSFHLTPGAIGQQLAFSCLSASIIEQKKWLTHNRSKLNAEKTNALLVSSASNIKCVILCPLVLNDALITLSPVVHYLGVLLHSHLKVGLQLCSGSKKTYFHL